MRWTEKLVIAVFGLGGLLYLWYVASTDGSISFEDWLQQFSVIDAGSDALTMTKAVISGSSPGNVEAKIQALMAAIASAEGFGVPGAVPTTHNNPGDLGPGDTGYPGELHSGSIVSMLPDVETGWRLLHRKISNIVNGTSRVYSLDMTFTRMAQSYAGDWQNWVKNVTKALGITPETTLQQFFFGM